MIDKLRKMMQERTGHWQRLFDTEFPTVIRVLVDINLK